MYQDCNRGILTGDAQIHDRWIEYYQKLLNEENPRLNRAIGLAVDRVVEKITEHEVIKGMKSEKATGPDEISVEAWRVLAELE